MKIMSAPKYGLFPGDVVSKNDGDTHYITAPQLARCYGVNFGDCIVYSINDTIEMAEMYGLIPLFPDPTGEYKIPELESEPALERKIVKSWYNNYKESEHGSVLDLVSK